MEADKLLEQLVEADKLGTRALQVAVSAMAAEVAERVSKLCTGDSDRRGFLNVEALV